MVATLKRLHHILSIAGGYTRLPPTEAEGHAALVSLSEAILEERW